MADLAEFKSWLERDFSRKDVVKILEDVDDRPRKRELKIHLYTAANCYSIKAVEPKPYPGPATSYLGCICVSRIALPGEEHNRGSDLPDGALSEDNYNRILAAIVLHELQTIHRKPIGISKQDIGEKT